MVTVRYVAQIMRFSNLCICLGSRDLVIFVWIMTITLTKTRNVLSVNRLKCTCRYIAKPYPVAVIHWEFVFETGVYKLPLTFIYFWYEDLPTAMCLYDKHKYVNTDEQKVE